MSVTHLVAKNSVVSGASMFLRMGVSLALTPFLIGALGRELYGIWVLALTFSVTGYLALFSLGISAAQVRETAAHLARGAMDEVNQVVSASLIAYLLLGAIAAGVVAIFASQFLESAFNIPSGYFWTAKILLGIIALQALFDFPSMAFDGLLSGMQRYDVISIVELARSLVFAGMTVALLRRGYGVLALGVMLVLLSVGRLGIYVIIVRRLAPDFRLRWRPRGRAVAEMIRLSGKMLLLRVNALVYGQMDKAVVGAILTTTALADYDVASRFHSLALVTMGLVSSVIMPASASLAALEDSTHLRALFLQATRFAAACALPVIVAMCILARPLLRFWVGEEFARDASLVWLFLSYTTFWVLVDVGWNVMIGMGRANDILRIQIGTTLLNLTVSVFATQRIGLAGVLVGTLVGNAFAAALYLHLYLGAVDVSLGSFLREVVWKAYSPALASGGLLVAASSLRPPNSLLETAAYGLASVLLYYLLFMTKGMKANERSFAVTLLRSALLDR